MSCLIQVPPGLQDGFRIGTAGHAVEEVDEGPPQQPAPPTYRDSMVWALARLGTRHHHEPTPPGWQREVGEPELPPLDGNPALHVPVRVVLLPAPWVTATSGDAFFYPLPLLCYLSARFIVLTLTTTSHGLRWGCQHFCLCLASAADMGCCIRQ